MSIEAETGLNQKTIDELLRWFARQNRDIQLQILNEDNFTKLIKIINKIKSQVESGQAKKYDRNLETLSEAENLRLQQLKKQRSKPSPKARKIYKRKELIKRLRGKEYGWYTIAQYLAKYSQLNVTPSYLRRVCVDWEIE